MGKTVAHYVILREIGRGGMGVVYEAEDTRLGRHVALKFLPAELQASDARERFTFEARAASSLNHPNICTIYEINEADGHPFIAMELLEGETLDGLLAAPALTLERSLRISLQLAEALDAAHSRGIIHRDVKPANIFITKSGQVKVLDFGLAKLTRHAHTAELTRIGAATHLTSPGTAVGTVAYMSPEQARGEELDARSDLFSAGVVIFEMITGRRPFDGSTSAVIFAGILTTAAPLASGINALVPAKLTEIVEKLLEKDPELRYQSAADFRADLMRLKREGEISGLRSSPQAASSVLLRPKSEALQSAIIVVRRHVWKSVFFAAVLISILAAAAVGVYEVFIPHGPSGAPVLQHMSKITRDGNAEVVAISPEGRLLMIAASDHKKQSLSLRDILSNTSQEVMPPEAVQYDSLRFSLDGSYIFFRRDTSDGADLFRASIFGGTPGKVLDGIDSEITFSPDGQRFAFVRRSPSSHSQIDRFTIAIANIDGSQQRILTSSNTIDWQDVAWSPDGKLIAAAAWSPESSLAELVGVSLADGKINKLFSAKDLIITNSEWMPDGKGLIVLYESKDSGFRLQQVGYVSYPAGRFRTVTSDTNSYGFPSLSKDGSLLAAIQSQGGFNLYVSPASQPDQAEAPISSNEDLKFMSWTPANELLIDQGAGGTLLALSSDGRSRRTLLQDPAKNVTGPLSCGAGRYIVYTSIAGGHSTVWRMQADGANPVQLTNGVDDTAEFCSPNGKWVYILDETKNQFRRVSVEGGKPQPVALPQQNRFASISPDGHSVAMFDDLEGKLKLVICDPDSGATRHSFTPDPRLADSNTTRAPQFTPDGKSVAYVISEGNVDNIWAQPLDGSPGYPITRFASEEIRLFAWSPDGKLLALSRGHFESDVVLLRFAKPDAPPE